MIDSEMTMRELATCLGISANNLSRKVNNKLPWSVAEVYFVESILFELGGDLFSRIEEPAP
jgi:hypothetical protein